MDSFYRAMKVTKKIMMKNFLVRVKTKATLKPITREKDSTKLELNACSWCEAIGKVCKSHDYLWFNFWLDIKVV